MRYAFDAAAVFPRVATRARRPSAPGPESARRGVVVEVGGTGIEPERPAVGSLLDRARLRLRGARSRAGVVPPGPEVRSDSTPSSAPKAPSALEAATVPTAPHGPTPSDRTEPSIRNDPFPDFPPEAGPARGVALPPWAEVAVQTLLLALTAWLYIRSVWPGVAHGGGFDHNAWEAAALLKGHVFTPPPPGGATLDMLRLDGHWASFFPPMPAFLLVPLVWYYHNPLRVPVRLFCALLGTLCPLLVYHMTQRAGLRLGSRLWLTVLFAFGTVFWYSVDTGTPWYYVHVVTEFFALLALRESFGRNRPWVVSALFGAAFLSRNPVALGFPFLFWRERRLDWRRLAGFCLPAAAAVAVQLWWNWARTGNPLDSGYSHILMGSYFRPSFSEGMFSLKHLPYQIYSIFLMAPGFHGQPNFNGVWPYLTLSGAGQSLTLTTPAFIYALDGNIRRRAIWLGVCAVLLTMIPQLLYYANGTGQFGIRFSLDYTPLLMALLIFAIGHRLRWQHCALILASIFLCGYGAVYGAKVHLLPSAWLH